MSRELFGTDGIRGVAGTYPLDDAGTYQIGKAIGAYVKNQATTHQKKQIVIGYDPRESSPLIAEHVARGLRDVGCDTVMAGVIPTPGLAYVGSKGPFSAAVMITASHNPYTDNGIKVFDAQGGKLSDEDERALNELIDATIPAAKKPGTTRKDERLVKQYEDFLVTSMDKDRLDGLRVTIDTANGATSGIAQRVFERLGAHVTTINDRPNGKNINDKCGATDTRALAQAVSAQSNTIGIALDGDGDRLIMANNDGKECDGDALMYILATLGGHKGVVATVMSNMGFEKSLAEQQIKLHRTAVGDRYVLEGMADTSYRLGGEQSGHIILSDYTSTGDGLLAALQTVRHLQKSNLLLTDALKDLTLLPQALTNIPLRDKTLLDGKKVTQYITAQVDSLGDNGRILIRPSGTEPKARVMVEAPNAQELAEEIAKTLQGLLTH